MPRKKPGEAPKKRGRPRKDQAPTRGRPRKADDTTIVGTPITTSSAPVTGSRAYQVAMSKIGRAESFWGVGTGRPDRTMWADATGPAETDQEFRERLAGGRSNPEPTTVTTERALGEVGKRGEERIAPVRDRPLPSLVGPGVPSLRGTHRAVPLGDRDVSISTDTSIDDSGRVVPPTFVTFHGPVVHFPDTARPSAVVPAHMVSSQFRPKVTQVTGPRQTPGPRLFRSSRVQPQQAREEDADVYERLVHLHESIRGMMEDSGAPAYRPANTPPPPEASGLTELRGRVGDDTMKTWIDEDIKKKWEEDNAKPEVATSPEPKKEPFGKKSFNEIVIEEKEKMKSAPDAEAQARGAERRAARKAAEADMAEMDRENRNKKKK